MKYVYITAKLLTWINILKQRKQIHGVLKCLHKCLLDEFMKIYLVHSSISDNLLLDQVRSWVPSELLLQSTVTKGFFWSPHEIHMFLKFKNKYLKEMIAKKERETFCKIWKKCSQFF